MWCTWWPRGKCHAMFNGVAFAEWCIPEAFRCAIFFFLSPDKKSLDQSPVSRLAKSIRQIVHFSLPIWVKGLLFSLTKNLLLRESTSVTLVCKNDRADNHLRMQERFIRQSLLAILVSKEHFLALIAARRYTYFSCSLQVLNWRLNTFGIFMTQYLRARVERASAPSSSGS